MGHPDPDPPRLTLAQLAELQRDVDGTCGGLYVFVVSHRCSHCDDDGGIDDALVFIGEEASGDCCEEWYDIGTRMEQHVGEPLARILNAAPALLGTIKLGVQR